MAGSALTRRHIVSEFDADLRELAARVYHMGELGLSQLHAVCRGLVDSTPEVIRPTYGRERRINQLDMEIQEQVLTLLARHHPVASDLRFIVGMGRIATELERIGDEAKRIGRVVEREFDTPRRSADAGIYGDIERIYPETATLLADALRSLKEDSVDAAVSVVQRDANLDRGFSDALRRLSTYIFEDTRNLGYIIDVVLALKALERIGEHAANVAEHLIFAVSGKDVRYIQADHLSEGYLDA